MESSAQSELIFRLVLSLLLSFLIGLEREVRQQTAGLRTHVLVCLGATLYALIGITIIDPNMPGTDYTRIAAQVVVGIGFIGGGVIYKSEKKIHGLTTASTLWVSAALGLVIGFGEYMLAIVSTALIMIVIIGGKWIETTFLRTKSKINKK